MSRAGGIGAAALALAVGACGDAPWPRDRTSAAARTAERRPAPGVVEAVPDTASPAAYQIFELTVETESPRRLTLRLLTFEVESRDRISKALRLAFDSLAAVDPEVVAARAIVYAPRSIAAREADLLPIVWAYWIPPEGWDAARPESRKRTHRTYVYFGAPPDPAAIGSEAAR